MMKVFLKYIITDKAIDNLFHKIMLNFALTPKNMYMFKWQLKKHEHHLRAVKEYAHNGDESFSIFAPKDCVMNVAMVADRVYVELRTEQYDLIRRIEMQDYSKVLFYD